MSLYSLNDICIYMSKYNLYIDIYIYIVKLIYYINLKGKGKLLREEWGEIEDW